MDIDDPGQESSTHRHASQIRILQHLPVSLSIRLLLLLLRKSSKQGQIALERLKQGGKPPGKSPVGFKNKLRRPMHKDSDTTSKWRTFDANEVGGMSVLGVPGGNWIRV